MAGTVYFGDREVDGASASGFKTLRDGYGKDPWTVYSEGVEVKGTSAAFGCSPSRQEHGLSVSRFADL